MPSLSARPCSESHRRENLRVKITEPQDRPSTQTGLLSLSSDPGPIPLLSPQPTLSDLQDWQTLHTPCDGEGRSEFNSSPPSEVYAKDLSAPSPPDASAAAPVSASRWVLLSSSTEKGKGNDHWRALSFPHWLVSLFLDSNVCSPQVFRATSLSFSVGLFLEVFFSLLRRQNFLNHGLRLLSSSEG